MEKHINIDGIESITIFKRFEVPYEDIEKTHSKGEVKTTFGIFKKTYDEDIYEPTFTLGDMKILKSELSKYLNYEQVEFDVEGNIYYRPHIKIKYTNNNKSYVKYFQTFDDLTEFIKKLNKILTNRGMCFISLN